MLKKSKKIIFTLCVSAISTLLFANVSFAYVLFDRGYYEKQVPINTVNNVDSSYTSVINAAISSWNNAGTPCSIAGGSAPYKNEMYTDYWSDTFAGRYWPILENSTNPHHLTTWFQILINRSYTDNYTAQAKQGVIAHEFGHSFGLNEGNVNGSIMYYLTNLNFSYTPNYDDIQGVIASWNR